MAAAAPAVPAHIGSGTIGARWTVTGRTLGGLVIEDGLRGREIPIDTPFSLTFADGHVLTVADMLVERPVQDDALPANPQAGRLAERTGRHRIATTLIDRGGHLRVTWLLVEGPGASYLRELVTVAALDGDSAITRIDLLSSRIAGSQVVGRVDGSPVVADGAFLQFEHPLSKSSTSWIDGSVRLWIDRALPLRRGQSATFSAVVGVTRPGQLRRDFQSYVEHERAYPYRPFLHYNSWYDIGYQTPYTQGQALDRIHAFGEELVRKRGVKMDSFLFDVGMNIVGLGDPVGFEDEAEGRRSQRKIAALQFEAAAFGHGSPILSGASERVRKKWGRR